ISSIPLSPGWNRGTCRERWVLSSSFSCRLRSSQCSDGRSSTASINSGRTGRNIANPCARLLSSSSSGCQRLRRTFRKSRRLHRRGSKLSRSPNLIRFAPLFFMLAAKRQVWHATMQLFPPDQRTQVKEALSDVTQVLRSYLVGTALVGLGLVIASWLVFWIMGLDFPFLTALVSGLCNLVPYLGVVLSWIPPLLIGLKQYHTIGPFLGM